MYGDAVDDIAEMTILTRQDGDMNRLAHGDAIRADEFDELAGGRVSCREADCQGKEFQTYHNY